MGKIIKYIDFLFEIFYTKIKSHAEMMNCVGDIANDFEYKLKDNKIYSLHKLKADNTLLFFQTPECDDCLLAKDHIVLSTIINDLVDSGKLVVLSIYIDDNLEYWSKINYPNNWINSYDPGQIDC